MIRRLRRRMTAMVIAVLVLVSAGIILANHLSNEHSIRTQAEETLAELPENTEKLDDYIARRLKDPNDRDSVRKISAALFRRGYSWEEIRAALRRFHSETEED